MASWGACSNLCRQRQGCTAWSWHHENAGQWALWCVTMTGYGNTAHDTNVVSGGRDCSGPELPCPSVDVNTWSRQNAEETWNVASWSDCSDLCRQRQGCTAWTWHHENAGQWALWCVTMTGYGNTAHDTNVVSGGRDCGTGTFQPYTSMS